MKFKFDKNYIITVTIISITLSFLPHVRNLIYKGDAIYLIPERDHRTTKQDTIISYSLNRTVLTKIPEQIYQKAMTDTLFRNRTVKVLVEGDSRNYLMEMESTTEITIQLAFSFLFIFMLFIINYPIARPSNKFKKLNFSKVAIIIAVNGAVAYILSSAFNYIILMLIPNKSLIIQHFINPVNTSTLIVLVVTFYARLNYQRQQTLLENEKLKLESLLSQFESLKNQVSPHFLFNTLNALQTLIRETPQTAQQYVNHLSSVLRYTLQSTENEMVCLDDELKFTQSYIFLLGIRYETNLIIHINISEEYLNHQLPPLTLQTLIENAVKHNEISKRNPLTIHITTNSEMLVVINNLQKKLSPESGTGIGLSNLMKRYQFLTAKKIEIKRDKMEFKVEVPLLNPK